MQLYRDFLLRDEKQEQTSMGGVEFIERFNGTMRERLAALTRKCRHAACRLDGLERGMYLIGCTYNFCWPHHELSKPTHMVSTCTSEMVSRLTNV